MKYLHLSILTLWSMIAIKTINSTSACVVVAAAPRAIPSTAEWTTRPTVAVNFGPRLIPPSTSEILIKVLY